MPRCELIEKCIFFNDKMTEMPAMANIYKKKYCEENFSACARYVVCKAKGREQVPADLFPNQMNRVEGLLK